MQFSSLTGVEGQFCLLGKLDCLRSKKKCHRLKNDRFLTSFGGGLILSLPLLLLTISTLLVNQFIECPALTDSATTLALSSTLRTSSKPSTATCAAAPATGPSWRPSQPSAPKRARPLNPRRLTSPSSRTIAPREMTQVCIEFILGSIRGKHNVRWQHLSWMKDRLVCFRKTIIKVIKNAVV